MKPYEKLKQKIKITEEITPQKFQCGIIAGCPAVFSTNQGTLLIIGKKLEKTEAKKLLGNRVSEDETVIIVPKELITEIFEKK